MQILNVYPKEWHVQLELSLPQLEQILDFLDNCEFHGDPKDPKMNDSYQFVKNVFFKSLNGLAEDLRKGEVDGT